MSEFSDGLERIEPTLPPTPPQTKWSILEARLIELNDAANALAAEMASLARTRCDLHCSGCRAYLATEADFAKHFIVPNPRFLNLGECPQRPGSATAH